MTDGLAGIGQRQPPTNLQAEQGLLGALLANNSALDKVGAALKAEHFADPVNARLYAMLVERIGRGEEVDVVTLAGLLAPTSILAEVGGTNYLAQLVAAMPSPLLVRAYAAAITDSWGRRALIDAAEVARDNAWSDIGLSDVLQTTARALQAIETAAMGASKRQPRSMLEVVDRAFTLADAAARGDLPAGVMLGMPSIDKVLGGLEPGDFMVLGARPGMGKTALALKWAINAAKRGTPVGIVSIEMPGEQLGRRALSMLAGVSADSIKRGDIMKPIERLMRAREEMVGLPLWIEDGGRASMADIGAIARGLRQRHGSLGLLMIDHLHIVKPTDADARGGSTAAITGISHDAKELAKSLNAPLIMLAQLSRGVVGRDDHRPTLADLRQAGSIEEDADQVCFIHREEMFIARDEPIRREGESQEKHFDRVVAWQEHREKNAGRAQFIIEKNRGGEAAVIALNFEGFTTTFSDPADVEQADMGWSDT